MLRGEIYWADLTPRSGSEQKGKRPVLIISHNGFNTTPNWRSVIVVPISTSKEQTRRGHTVVLLSEQVGGLKKESVILCHQITTLDRTKLSQKIGVLPNKILKNVEQALKVALDLWEEEDTG